jgi:pSer/pThr/pTyr-binding forkhead associated (FHA) protein
MWLVVKDGPLAGRRYELTAELVLGREDADVTIDDPEMSRRHAVVRPTSGGGEVQDLGSLNGTRLNGEKIQDTARLAPGDELRLGRTVFLVEGTRSAGATVMGAAPEPPRAPTAPFGTYATPPSERSRRKIASRTLTSSFLSFGCVAAVAIALVIYFGQH